MNELYNYYLYSAGANYGTSPTFVHRNELPNQGFSSLYAVTKETAEAIATSGTTKGFRGVVYAQTLWMDIDSYTNAETVEKRLKEMGYGYIAYDSGGRGAHFNLVRECAPSHLLPATDKAWVKKHFPEADSSIYTHLHPFRLGGSIHERTGRRKEVVSSGEGKALVIPNSILEETNERHNDYNYSRNNSNNSSIFSLRRVKAFTKAYTEGERHAGLVKLAYALRDDAGASKELAAWYLGEVDKLSECPKGEQGVAEAMRSIYE